MPKIKVLCRYNESLEHGYIVDYGVTQKGKVLLRNLQCVQWQFGKDIADREGLYQDVDTGEIISGGKGLSLWPSKNEAIAAFDNGISGLRG